MALPRSSAKAVRSWMDSIIAKETIRQQNIINLISSENLAFPEVREAEGSILCNKYSEGYRDQRYYPGNENTKEVEARAITLAKKVFCVPKVNVQPYSGSIANLAVYMALMDKNDKFMGLNLKDGGHLSHGYKENAIPYHVDLMGLLDMNNVRRLALHHKPRFIWCGATAYSRTIPFREFGEIGTECNAYSVADISHIAAIVAGGAHPSPSEYVDVITTTTHKMGGPRAAMIMVTEKGLKKDAKLGEKIDNAVFPTLQGGPHMQTIFGIACMLELVSLPEFGIYAHQVVKNAQILANTLIVSGQDVVSKGTDTHQFLLDFRRYGVGRGKFVQLALEAINILVNPNTVPGDPSSPFYPSGIRVGTPTVTVRGAMEEDMEVLGVIMRECIQHTMALVDSLEDVRTFPQGTKEDRAQALRKFKECLRTAPFVRALRIHVDKLIQSLSVVS